MHSQVRPLFGAGGSVVASQTDLIGERAATKSSGKPSAPKGSIEQMDYFMQRALFLATAAIKRSRIYFAQRHPLTSYERRRP